MGENSRRIEELTSELDTLKNKLKSLREEHLKIIDSEKKYRLLAENMMDMVALHEPDGRFKYISPSVKRILGFKPEELIGTDPYKLFHPDDAKNIKNKSHSPVLKGKEIINTEYRIRKKDGTYIWFNTSTKPVKNQQNKITELQTVSKDITESRKTQDALIESEHKYKQLLENTHLGVAYYDTEGKVLYMNKVVSENFGGEPEDFIGKSLLDITDKKLAKFLIERMQKNLKIGKNKEYEDHFNQLGKDVYIVTNFSPVKNSTGEIIGALYITQVITEKKKTEIALKENEAKMRFLATTAIKLVSLPYDFDIYNFIADNVYKLISEKGVVIITNYLNNNYDWSFKATRGISAIAEVASKMIGKDITKLSGKGKSRVTELYTDIKLIELGNDIQEMSTGVIPRTIANKILKIFSIQNIYGIPLMQDGKSFGVVIIIKTNETQEINKNLIEAFVSQVSVFINRQKAELELKKYRQHLEELVQERTKELEEKNNELEEKNKDLERMNELFVGREFRIKELKDKLKELESKL